MGRVQNLSSCGLTLMVARNLEKGLGLLAFSASGEAAPSSTAAGLVGLEEPLFLPPRAKGKDDLRLSLLTSFFSPLTAGVVSVVSTGTLAGLETSVLRGSTVSGLGMTGASSETGGVSLAGVAGASSAFFLPNDRPPKRLETC